MKPGTRGGSEPVSVTLNEVQNGCSWAVVSDGCMKLLSHRKRLQVGW